MIRQKLHTQNMVQFLNTVQFNALIVVHENGIFLGHSTHRFVMKKAQIVNGFHDIDFKIELFTDPFK